jgi:translation initiation factor 5B
MPMDEIRDPREQFKICEEVSAAAGVKISAQNLENVLSGAQIRVAENNLDDVVNEIKAKSKIDVETADEGIIVKADAVGSLEALIYELKEAGVPIKRAEIGDVSKKDVVEASTIGNELFRMIFAFNVKVLPDAKDGLERSQATILENSVIYQLMEDYGAWAEKKKQELEKEARGAITHPGSIKVLPDCVFRVSKPAIFGVRVLAGRIRASQGILKPDGRVIGKIKSIQHEGKGVKEAIAGDEVAISVDGVTIGRQLDVEDILYIDIPESHVKLLNPSELNVDEQEILQKLMDIKRKKNPFWGM